VGAERIGEGHGRALSGLLLPKGRNQRRTGTGENFVAARSSAARERLLDVVKAAGDGASLLHVPRLSSIRSALGLDDTSILNGKCASSSQTHPALGTGDLSIIESKAILSRRRLHVPFTDKFILTGSARKLVAGVQPSGGLR